MATETSPTMCDSYTQCDGSPSPTPSGTVEESIDPPSPTPAGTADNTAAAAIYDPIEQPKYDKRVEAGFVTNLLGLELRADKKPLQDLVRTVWRSQPGWATSKRSYTELSEMQRRDAEEQLQRELEESYPAETLTGTQIRRCRAWLPQHLLGEKHKNRSKGSKRKQASPPA